MATSRVRTSRSNIVGPRVSTIVCRLRRRVAPESTRSTHRVTSPFPGSLRPETLHIHRPADLPDVYAGIGSDSRPYDAIFYVFPVLQPVPAELHALRLLLAC